MTGGGGGGRREGTLRASNKSLSGGAIFCELWPPQRIFIFLTESYLEVTDRHTMSGDKNTVMQKIRPYNYYVGHTGLDSSRDQWMNLFCHGKSEWLENSPWK